MGRKELEKQIQNRVGQCVLTSPTSACFSGMSSGKPIALGKNLRFFGDGYQISKKLGHRRYWRIPVMDGEFVCEEMTLMIKAIGGGNFLMLARDPETTWNQIGPNAQYDALTYAAWQEDGVVSDWVVPGAESWKQLRDSGQYAAAHTAHNTAIIRNEYS